MAGMDVIDVLTSQLKAPTSFLQREIQWVEHKIAKQSTFVKQNASKPSLVRVEIVGADSDDDFPSPSRYITSPLFVRSLLTNTSQLAQTPPLANPGVTCYLNAALQGLLSLPPFRHLLLSQQHATRLAAHAIPTALHKTTQAMGSARRLHLPTPLIRQLPALGLSPFQQEDASELIMKLLDSIADAETATGVEERTLTQRDRETTTVDQLFGVRVVQSVECTACGDTSQSSQIHRVLPLQPKKKGLQHMLRAYSKPEIIAGRKCPSCGKAADCRKTLALVGHAPPLLAVSVNRWDAYGRKRRQQVALHDQETVLGQEYRLSAVVCHTGPGLHTGHYYTYQRHTAGPHWLLRDDDETTRASAREVLRGDEAYVMLYRSTRKYQQAVQEMMGEGQAPAAASDVDMTGGVASGAVGGRVRAFTKTQQQKQKKQAEQEAAEAPAAPAPTTAATAPVRKEVRTRVRRAALDIPEADPWDVRVRPLVPYSATRPGGAMSLISPLLHSAPRELDAQIDRGRQRKTKEVREANRRKRDLEIEERRYMKTEKWMDKKRRWGVSSRGPRRGGPGGGRGPHRGPQRPRFKRQKQ